MDILYLTVSFLTVASKLSLLVIFKTACSYGWVPLLISEFIINLILLGVYYSPQC